MSNEQVRELLAQLQKELQETKLDADTRSLVKELDADIHNLLESEHAGEESGSVLRRAKELEANFASEHPTAERFMREVIDALARMGI